MTGFAFGQSGRYVKLAGSKYSIIPPAGFVQTKKLSAIQNDKKDANIIVNEVPASAQSVAASFSQFSLAQKGMTLVDKQPIEFDSLVAEYIIATQVINKKSYLKHIFVFGTKDASTIVVGTFPEQNKEMEESIRASLLSTKYNKDQKNDPYDILSYKLSIDTNDFRLAMTYPGSLVYTPDGKINTTSAIITVKDAFGKIPAAARKEFAIAKIKKLPGGEYATVGSVAAVKIDNMPGYEIIATGKNKREKDQTIYEVVLFGNGRYYTIAGIATEDINNNLQRFRRISETFKRK